MHRSGTSLVAGLLHLSGISSGKNLLNPKNENPKGFFEIEQLYHVNEEILKASGTRWNMLKKPILDSIEKTIYKSKIKEIINSEFKADEVFVIKDPRICVLLSLYMEIFEELNIKVFPVIVRRNFAEIAYSLNTRNNYNLYNGYSLSKHYYQSIKTSLLDKFYISLKYVEIIGSPQITLDKVFKFVELQKPDLDSKVFDFVDRNLYRNRLNFLIKFIIKTFGEIKYQYFKFKFGL